MERLERRTGGPEPSADDDTSDHTRKPEFHYFHVWRPGDMILWDNWRAMHCTTGTPPGVKRLIHRTTIEGDVTLGRQLDYSSGITS